MLEIVWPEMLYCASMEEKYLKAIPTILFLYSYGQYALEFRMISVQLFSFVLMTRDWTFEEFNVTKSNTGHLSFCLCFQNITVLRTHLKCTSFNSTRTFTNIQLFCKDLLSSKHYVLLICYLLMTQRKKKHGPQNIIDFANTFT